MPLHWAHAPNACMHWERAPNEDLSMHVGCSMKSRCTMHLCRGCAICGAYLDSPACVGNVFGTNVGNVCGGQTGSTAYASNSRMNWLMGIADALGGTCKGKCNRTVVQTWGHFQRQVRVTRPLTTQAVSLPNLFVVCSVGSEFPRVVLGVAIEATPSRIDRGALRY